MDGATSQGYLAIPLVGSVTDEAQVEAMFERAEAELGPVWLLVNNAGIFNAAPTSELTVEMWDSAFDVDAKGVCARGLRSAG